MGDVSEESEEKVIDIASWTPEAELLLKEWSEKSGCYRWLHAQAEKKYRRRNYMFSIPVIVLSTLTGTANFGMSSYVSEDNENTAKAIVGGFNLFAGVLSTLHTFLKISELQESHRISGVSWSKLGRNIAIELALDPSRRQNANDFLNICRAEYDRLIEQSPLIGDDIIRSFKSSFKNLDYEVAQPSITNGLDRCIIYKKDEIEKIHRQISESITQEAYDTDEDINDQP